MSIDYPQRSQLSDTYMYEYVRTPALCVTCIYVHAVNYYPYTCARQHSTLLLSTDGCVRVCASALRHLHNYYISEALQT